MRLPTNDFDYLPPRRQTDVPRNMLGARLDEPTRDRVDEMADEFSLTLGDLITVLVNKYYEEVYTPLAETEAKRA